MKQIQLIQLSPEEFSENILSGMRAQMEDLKRNFKPKTPEELLTRQEAADMLKVDISSIYNYTKRGILKPYGIGSRVYYKRSEIEASLVYLGKTK